jgi:hypothetical protein
MTSRVIETQADLDLWITFLRSKKRPMTVSQEDGRHRSVEQNKLQRLWCNEVAEQLGDHTPEEVRAISKLEIAVPILRAEDEEFRAAYDANIRGLPYETKLACMKEPIDLPVTRRMNVTQKKRFLDEMHRYWSEKGVLLTDPNPLRRAA